MELNGNMTFFFVLPQLLRACICILISCSVGQYNANQMYFFIDITKAVSFATYQVYQISFCGHSIRSYQELMLNLQCEVTALKYLLSVMSSWLNLRKFERQRRKMYSMVIINDLQRDFNTSHPLQSIPDVLFGFLQVNFRGLAVNVVSEGIQNCTANHTSSIFYIPHRCFALWRLTDL